MIDRAKLAELRKFFPCQEVWLNGTVTVSGQEILETLDKLFAVYEAAEKCIGRVSFHLKYTDELEAWRKALAELRGAEK